MANDLTRNTWIIDTPAATPISTGQLKIKSVRWVGATLATHAAKIQDATGREIWVAEAQAADYGEESLLDQWINGMIVPTLTSGKLYIGLA